MSQGVSVRGTGGAVFAGILLIIGGGLWMLQGVRRHRQGDVLRRERELLDHYERQYLGMDTPGWRHHRSRGGFRRLFGSGLGALAGDLHRRHLSVRELRVHPVGALVGIDDHLHRPVGDPLAVRASPPAGLTKGETCDAPARRTGTRRVGTAERDHR